MRGQIPPPRRDHHSAPLADAGFLGIDSPVLWPVAPSGDGQGKRTDLYGDSAGSLPIMTPSLSGFQMPTHSGDGHGQSLPFMQPSLAQPRVVSTPKGEVMKLVMLVVFFLLWISTASTLLFLYMDRYLFPG